MIEREFENIISRYPCLIEEGLFLKGRQVYVEGKYVDLLFKDRHGQNLIVELKVGTIVRKHIAQLLEYEGHFLTSDDPTVRVVLIGNRVPRNLQRALDHHGFEWKEIPLSRLSDFLEKRMDREYLKYFAEEQLEEPGYKKVSQSRVSRKKPTVIPSSRAWANLSASSSEPTIFP